MEAAYSALVYAALLGALVTLARLAASGLCLRYPWFTAWVASNIAKSAIFSYTSQTFGISSPEYVTAWQYAHAMTAILLVAAGIEAYSHIANDCPRIGSYGRDVLAWSSLAAVAIALMPVGVDGISDRLHTNTLIVGVIVRSSALMVGIGLTIAVSRIRTVPIPERKNLIYHRWLLIAYCAGQAAGMSMLVCTGNRTWSAVYLGSAAVCLCLWPFLLTPKGEHLDRANFSEVEKAQIEDRWREFSDAVMDITEQERADRNRARD